MSVDLNVLALHKGEERYIFVFDDYSEEQLIAAFRDQAANPKLSLNWFDASVLTEKAKEQLAMFSEDYEDSRLNT